MTEVLLIQNACKKLGTKSVLQNINLKISAGTTHGLIGLNGAGKTTLIKCILDLQRADSGKITVEGKPSLDKASRKNLIYLPEKFSPPDYMSGWTYSHYISEAHWTRQKDKLSARVKSLSELLNLNPEFLAQKVKTYSKGMLQKLGILGCLLSDKSFLILDEPMSGLDPKARKIFRDIITNLKAEGKTVLICSHILADIETLCDEISILNQGEICFSGTPESCCENYGSSDLETAFLKSIENNTSFQNAGAGQ